VPVGFQLQCEALEADAGLRKRFFAELDLIFYAGATLPKAVWDGLGAMARAETGRVPLITTSWGLTETAPACFLQHEPSDRAGRIGVPLPGVEAKLIPLDDERFEIRVRGPSIMPGYYRDPGKSAAAFDEEGYFLTGDAVKFIDPDDPAQGVSFEGRVSEDFKLLTGTWVRAAQIRLDCLGALAPLVSDIVVTGHDRAEVGLLLFPNMEALAAAGIETEAAGGALTGASLAREIAARLGTRPGQSAGSSERIARALVMAEPPSVADAEITAKGNLNIVRVLARRKALVERLFDDEDPAVIRP
jgi:feruloyl-CoA synthase